MSLPSFSIVVGQIHGKTGPTRLWRTLQEDPLVVVVVMVNFLLRRRIGEWKKQARRGRRTSCCGGTTSGRGPGHGHHGHGATCTSPRVHMLFNDSGRLPVALIVGSVVDGHAAAAAVGMVEISQRERVEKCMPYAIGCHEAAGRYVHIHTRIGIYSHIYRHTYIHTYIYTLNHRLYLSPSTKLDFGLGPDFCRGRLHRRGFVSLRRRHSFHGVLRSHYRYLKNKTCLVPPSHTRENGFF